MSRQPPSLTHLLMAAVKPALGYALAGAAVGFVVPGFDWKTGAKVGAVGGAVVGTLGYVGRQAMIAKNGPRRGPVIEASDIPPQVGASVTGGAPEPVPYAGMNVSMGGM